MKESPDKVDSKIEQIKSEAEDFYSDDDLYNINSWGADLSFRELVDRYKEGEIIKPELQRHYVWEKSEASRFIDSILLGLPVPSIFLAKPDQDKEDLLIVDGYQRIMTVHDFIEGIFKTDGKVFKLTNSNRVNKRWRGKAFKELDENQQKKIRNTTIHSIIFVQVKPRNDTGMYQIFERINTSGRTLLPQEIRNCVYQGPFNKLLFKLNMNEDWRVMFGLPQPDPRMRDLEFILRYFALSSTKWDLADDGSISLKKFLNEYMGSAESHSREVLQSRASEFETVISHVRKWFGDFAFQNVSSTSQKSTGKFNPTVFDSLMIAAKHAMTSGRRYDASEVNDSRSALLRQENFQDLLRIRTTNKDRIAQRIAYTMHKVFGLEYE